MNPQMLEGLARQRRVELYQDAIQRPVSHRSEPLASIRVRTGWTLIHLGLRLAVQPAQRAAVTPRPARS
jgi:hypothetical protein